MSKIAICNMALRFFGQEAITRLDDNTPLAIHCRTFYDPALKDLLRLHPWNFAQARVSLARMDISDEWAREYLLAYAYPDKCMALHYLISPAGRQSRRFTVAALAGRRAVLTNIPEALAACTVFIDDTGMFDPSFSMALARRLQALILKATLKSDSAQVREAEELFRQALATARTADAKEGRPFRDDGEFWNGGQDIWEAGMKHLG